MLTLASALSSLTTAGAFVSGASTDTKKAVLNQAVQTVLESGRFIGTEQEITVSVNTYGILRLPRHFLTIKGATVDGYATNLASKWWAYLPSADALTQALYTSNVQDKGHGFCTFSDPQSSVRLKLAAVGVTDTALVQGADENGDTIYMADGSLGWELDINDSSWTTQHFTSLSSIQMPVTDVVKILTAIDADNVVTTLGIYEPGETVPDYRGYYVSAADVDGEEDLESTSVVALCQRRFVELISDSDLVYPSHIPALKHACLSVHWSNEAEEGREQFNLNKAISLLNAQFKRATPESEQGRIRINYVGGGVPQRALY